MELICCAATVQKPRMDKAHRGRLLLYSSELYKSRYESERRQWKYNKEEDRRTSKINQTNCWPVLANKLESPNFEKDCIHYLALEMQGSVNVSSWKYAKGT